MGDEKTNILERPSVKSESRTSASGSGSGSVVLRDESDEIIDNLKRQLSELQGHLDEYETEDGPGGGDPIIHEWESAMAPHLASRLQAPTEELTGRLDRLIDQAEDPGMRDELVKCRDIAFYLFDTFGRISENHKLLTDSLTTPKEVVEIADFIRLLEHSGGGTPLPLYKSPGLPRRLSIASSPAATVIRSLVELAVTLSGKNMQLEVAPGSNPEAPSLQIRVVSAEPWGVAPGEEEITVFAMKKQAHAGIVVDLLYVEKIIELQEGSMKFHRRDGEVVGFAVELPYKEP